MIVYRFLYPAEEEMTEASQFYEAASTGLGSDFLDDLSITSVNIQILVTRWVVALGERFCTDFHLA